MLHDTVDPWASNLIYLHAGEEFKVLNNSFCTAKQTKKALLTFVKDVSKLVKS